MTSEKREHLVTAYFKKELGKLGYTVKDIEWRLGHCQGDGMAFYGTVSANDLVAIARRIMDGRGVEKFAAYRAIAAGSSISIGRNSYGHHYSHFNTMDVTSEYIGDDDTEKGGSAVMENAFDQMVRGIVEEVREMSKKLADDGYEIMDAFRWEDECVRTFRTGRFEVRVIELKEEPEFIFPSELDDLDYESLVRGRVRITGLKVEIWSLDDDGDTEDLVGDDNIGYIWVDREKPSRAYHGCLTDCLSEAIAEARKCLGIEKKPRLSAAA